MQIELSRNYEIALFLWYDKKHTDILKIIPKKMPLKTLFLSGKLAISMMAIPALTFELNKNRETGHKIRYGLPLKNRYN